MVQLQNAVNRFGNLILNDLVKDEKIECWIAGGCLRDYFSGINEQTDIDIFFSNQENYDKALNYFKEMGAEVIFDGENDCKLLLDNMKYDLIKKFFNGPQETIEAFDFTASMFAVDTQKVYHGETSFIDLAKKQLMFNKILYPVSSLKRTLKYHKKGFQMCDGELKKLTEALFQESIKYLTVKLPEPVKNNSNDDDDEYFEDALFSGID